MDFFPTFLTMLNAEIPADRIIDGQNILAQLPIRLSGDDNMEDTPVQDVDPRPFFFYCNDLLFAVRYRNFKVHFLTMPVKSKLEYEQTTQCDEAGFPKANYFSCMWCNAPCVKKHDPPLLYNVEADPGEAYPLDPSLHEDFMSELHDVIKEHQENMVPGKPLFSTISVSSIPCCDPNNLGCSCNYPWPHMQTPSLFNNVFQVISNEKGPTFL